MPLSLLLKVEFTKAEDSCDPVASGLAESMQHEKRAVGLNQSCTVTESNFSLSGPSFFKEADSMVAYHLILQLSYLVRQVGNTCSF